MQYTGKDHMAAAFGNGYTDRIAVRTMQTFRHVLGNAGVTSKEVLTQPEKYVKALVALWEAVPSDALAISAGADRTLFAEMVGLSMQELKALGPGKTVLDDKSNLNKLKINDAGQYERIGFFREIFEEGSKALPDVVLDAFGLSPWTTAMKLRGIETMIYDTIDDPGFVHALLRVATELSKVVGDALLETNVGMLTIGDPSAGCSVISPKMFREWAKPYMEETVRHLKRRSNTPIFLHVCGYTDPIMEDLVSIGVDGLSIDAPSSLKKLVEISQKQITIEGNFPGELYIEGTKEQIEEKVKESVDTAAEPNGYRYILCSGCQVPDPAPLENVRTFLEAGHRYGRHRIDS